MEQFKFMELHYTFDPELSLNFHCEYEINKLQSLFRIRRNFIKRNFTYLTEDAFVSLYNSLVRCHLDMPTWYGTLLHSHTWAD